MTCAELQSLTECHQQAVEFAATGHTMIRLTGAWYALTLL
jgi:hypothetical protein